MRHRTLLAVFVALRPRTVYSRPLEAKPYSAKAYRGLSVVGACHSCRFKGARLRLRVGAQESKSTRSVRFGTGGGRISGVGFMVYSIEIRVLGLLPAGSVPRPQGSGEQINSVESSRFYLPQSTISPCSPDLKLLCPTTLLKILATAS